MHMLLSIQNLLPLSHLVKVYKAISVAFLFRRYLFHFGYVAFVFSGLLLHSLFVEGSFSSETFVY